MRRSGAPLSFTLGLSNMSERKTVEVYYPIWLQVVSLLGVPALTVVSLWLISRPVWEEGIGRSQFLVGVVLGCAVLYQCAIGWRALCYLRVRMIASDDGLEIISGRSRRRFSWNVLAAPKEYSFATTTRFQLRSGEILIYAFDNMKNLDLLKEIFARSNANDSR